MSYPDKKLTVDALLDAARKAAFMSDVQHPEDIAAAMVGALDGAASAVWYLHTRAMQARTMSDEEMGG